MELGWGRRTSYSIGWSATNNSGNHGCWIDINDIPLRYLSEFQKYSGDSISHRIHGAGIYANIWGILMVNVTIPYIIYSYTFFVSTYRQLLRHASGGSGPTSWLRRRSVRRWASMIPPCGSALASRTLDLGMIGIAWYSHGMPISTQINMENYDS